MKSIQEEIAILTGIKLLPDQMYALFYYEKELISWNENFNLTTITTPQDIHIRHFLDSLSCLQVIRDRKPFRLIDVGTGAGFPGIPIKIALPEVKLTLVESIGKKADFCRYIVNELKLQEVEILHARAENIGQDSCYREQFDWSVARAVAALPTLLEYLLPLVKIGGKSLAQKGKTAHEEVEKAQHTIRLLGGELESIHAVDIPKVEEKRFLIVINKVSSSPSKYPRRAGIPTKRPL